MWRPLTEGKFCPLREVNGSEQDTELDAKAGPRCKVIFFFFFFPSFDPHKWISFWGVIICYDCAFLAKHQDMLLQWQFAAPCK